LNADNFRHFWQQNFPNCPPVSYLFKVELYDCWFRFHSLPESKRYADNETEFAEMLRRQNTVLLDVIGTDNECVLVSGYYSGSLSLEEECPALSHFDFHDFLKLSKQDFDPIDLEPDEEPIYLNLFCATHKLKHGFLDDILLCVAEEQTRNFFIVNCERERIFAPYDGGVDVILKEKKERDEFKTKYKDWLSHHPLGF
jgi:hypothetical protein